MDKNQTTALTALRAQIDTLDDQLHDLLMQRADIVADVARTGGKARSPLRPGREAQILRRLLARHHGAMPRQALVRIWRELLAGSSLQQGGFTVAVADTTTQYVQAAREHFGALTPLRIAPTATQTISDVLTGKAAIGVVPMPTGEAHPEGYWWTALPYGAAVRPHVVGKLPFWAEPRTESAPGVQALLISAVPPDPSGNDRTLILTEATDTTRIISTLTEVGLPSGPSILSRYEGGVRILADIPGFVREDDDRLARLAAVCKAAPIILGAYATPFCG